ncbi:MAG: sugar transferase [Patescibacteria group bacterium]|nr:sugar transferase [Patescibacteria group bacterium]
MLYTVIKRLLDIFIAVLAIIIGFPLFLLVSLAIWLEDQGSIIYSQVRVGKDRAPFRIYKFRSMVENADEILFSNSQLYEKMRSGSHKVENDPRITKVGKFIRKYSIDEFPQFFNVLKGEMSFVGPRAYRPDELEMCENERLDRREQLENILKVKPGITGLWQVSGRSNLSFEERLNLEERYALSHSLLLDFFIILKTPIAVIKAEGAV